MGGGGKGAPTLMMGKYEKSKMCKVKFQENINRLIGDGLKTESEEIF